MLRILTDTTSCLSPEAGRSLGIVVVPQLVNFDGKLLTEWLDFTPVEHLERLKEAKTQPTSQPVSVDVFEQVLRPMAEAGDSVVCIHPSREMSKLVDIVGQAASRFGGADIRVLDSRLIASPMATMAILAAGWARQGADANEVVFRLTKMARQARVFFLLASLDYLQRSGRIGGARALLGSLLGLKPVLTVRNGEVDSFETARTTRHGILRLKELVVSMSGDEEIHLSVMHAGDLQGAKQVAQELGWTLDISAKVPVYDIPPTVATHVGPGTLGVSFFVDDE